MIDGLAAEGRRSPTKPGRRGGFSLPEVMVVLTLMGILITMAAPSFQRSIEKSKADVAVANLRAIWSAERFYWLDNRAYSDSLTQLTNLDLLDPSLTAATGPQPYQYELATAPDGSTFKATARRADGSRWVGAFTVDQAGTIAGGIVAEGEPEILPSTL